MEIAPLPVDQILVGDCLDILNKLPENSIDLVFADPPYNLQLQQELWRPNMTRVAAVEEEWDHFKSFQAYDEFTRQWLGACQKVLKDDGALWVIGTYHNIFRIGSILQDLGFWILNDVVWIKTNPMPNFHGVRLTNAHETLIWASKNRNSRYTFNYQAMKAHNDDLQMRSDWLFPICTGSERIKLNGKKAHPTQKPEALLYRIIMTSTRPGYVILDPFFGTGTTGAVARRLHRHFIGIEKDISYANLSRQRISAISPEPYDEAIFNLPLPRRQVARVSIGALLENGLLNPGQVVFLNGNHNNPARLRADGHLVMGELTGSIHQIGRQLLHGLPCNGWEVWFFEDGNGELQPLDALRKKMRQIQDTQSG